MTISVVICTHNPRPSVLERTLAALRQQSLQPASWELIVVDNASTDPISESFDLSWHPRARFVHEKELGLSSARRKGVQEASGDIIVFVDDDNILAEDYLEIAGLTMRDESIGVLGGGIAPAVEDGSSLPAFFYSYAGWYACGVQCGSPQNVDAILVDRTQDPYGTLFGAGMVARRVDLDRLYKLATFPLLSGRTGNSLAGGEDHEICHLFALMGKKVVYSPRLSLHHLLPPARLTPSYLVRLTASKPEESRTLRCYAAARRAISSKNRPLHFAKCLLRGLLRPSSYSDRFVLGVSWRAGWLLAERDRPALKNVVVAQTTARNNRRI